MKFHTRRYHDNLIILTCTHPQTLAAPQVPLPWVHPLIALMRTLSSRAQRRRRSGGGCNRGKSHLIINPTLPLGSAFAFPPLLPFGKFAYRGSRLRSRRTLGPGNVATVGNHPCGYPGPPVPQSRPIRRASTPPHSPQPSIWRQEPNHKTRSHSDGCNRPGFSTVGCLCCRAVWLFRAYFPLICTSPCRRRY